MTEPDSTENRSTNLKASVLRYCPSRILAPNPLLLQYVNVKVKVVVCDVNYEARVRNVEKGRVVKRAGGAAMTLANNKVHGDLIPAEVHLPPASYVSYSDGLKIKSYIKSSSTSTPKESISFSGMVTGNNVLAPLIASFSSRGPNRADPNILKRDIIGPGVNILAAWPFEVGSPAVRFNINSGTSTAVLYPSGAAALLKSQHPDWPPAAIKSAITMTATTTASSGSLIAYQNHNPAEFFATGSGHVNPTSASCPGLIYDIKASDCIPYLCGLQYAYDLVRTIARRCIKCYKIAPISGAELNYPSFMVFLSDGSR